MHFGVVDHIRAPALTTADRRPPSWNRITDSTHAPPVENGISEPHWLNTPLIGETLGVHVAQRFLCCVFVFVLCTKMLPVSLDCPFLIAPSVFCSVNLRIHLF